jgi:hypothetical protein
LRSLWGVSFDQPDQGQARAASATRARSYILCLTLALGCVAQAGDAASAEPVQHIVVQNFYYALPGKAEEVYQWRLHASDVRVKLGLRPGRVLKIKRGLEDDGRDDFADVVWECDYPDAASRAADNKVLDGVCAGLRHFHRLHWRRD